MDYADKLKADPIAKGELIRAALLLNLAVLSRNATLHNVRLKGVGIPVALRAVAHAHFFIGNRRHLITIHSEGEGERLFDAAIDAIQKLVVSDIWDNITRLQSSANDNGPGTSRS
jgi:hypothetical protein